MSVCGGKKRKKTGVKDIDFNLIQCNVLFPPPPQTVVCLFLF